MPRILVTDGDERAALAVVRSLGRAGHDVTVCGRRARSLAAASRHCRRSFEVPDPLTIPEQFTAGVLQAAREVDADVLLPISEAALLALLPRRELFRAQLPFVAAEHFERLCDKSLVLDRAAQLGIAVPRQDVVRRPDEFGPLAGKGLRFPLVVKPSRSVSSCDGHRVKLGVLYAEDESALLRVVSPLPAQAYPLLLQERITGPGVGVFMLVWDGDVRASFGHRRLREKPPSGGVSVYRESMMPAAELVERSRALLAAFDWNGVAMVEYKMDGSTGTPYLMEINGRFWGSLQLAIDAGVDFPALLVECALGQSAKRASGYRVGVRSRWLMGDVDHLLARLFKPAAELSIPPGAAGRLRTFLDFVRAFGPSSHDEVLRFDDPRPFGVELSEWLRAAR